jgi:MtN3 and saliva related transmembrane protein
VEAMLPTVVGLAAGCIGTYSFVPPVLKCWRTGETGAISLRMFAVRTFGAVLWTFYGFVIWSVPVLIFGAVGLLLCLTILVLKVRGNRSTPDGPLSSWPECHPLALG